MPSRASDPLLARFYNFAARRELLLVLTAFTAKCSLDSTACAVWRPWSEWAAASGVSAASSRMRLRRSPKDRREVVPRELGAQRLDLLEDVRLERLC